MQSDSKNVENFKVTNRIPIYRDTPWVNIGDHTYGEPIIQSMGNCELNIGKYCSIGHNVFIEFQNQHVTDWVSTYPFAILPDVWPTDEALKNTGIFVRNKINIGNDVWIGAHTKILGGSSIGHGAVIGAHSVVAGGVPPYAVAVGNPAKVLRYRFPTEIMAKLLKIQWWDWPDEKVRKFLPLMCSNTIERFLEEAEKSI